VPVKLLALNALVAVSAALTWPLTVWLVGARLGAAATVTSKLHSGQGQEPIKLSLAVPTATAV